MKKNLFSLLLIGSAALLGGCTQQNDISALQRRIAEQNQEIATLNRQVSGVQPAQADTWAQVQAMRQELETLRGQIDNINHATQAAGGLEGLAGQVGRHQTALEAINTQFGMNLQLQGGLPTSQMPARQLPTGQTPLPPASVQPASPPSQPSLPPAVSADTAINLYDTGISSFNSRNYQQAFNAFRDFTDNYADHKLIANAWFWRGESNYQLGNYAAAALDYETVISKYPDSAKLPASYLKQGMSFFKTAKPEAARFRLDELLKKFPDSPEAKRALTVLAENK